MKYKTIYEYAYLKQNINTIKSLELFSTKRAGIILIPEQLVRALKSSNIEHFANELIGLKQKMEGLDYFDDIRFCNIGSKKFSNKLGLLEARLNRKIYSSSNFYKLENTLYGWGFEQYELITVNLIVDYPIRKVVIFRSARDYHIERAFKLLNEHSKGAEHYLIVQEGSYKCLSDIFEDEKKIIIPDGFFSILTTGVKLHKILKRIQPDLIVIPYMSADGEGYFQLNLFSILAPAKFKYGFNLAGELKPLRISLETILASAFRIILAGIITLIIRFVTRPYHRIRKKVSRGEIRC